MGGLGPSNPTNPDWPDPDLPHVATVAEKLPWPLNEIFGGRTLSSEELKDLRRFLDPYTLRRLRSEAGNAQDDAARSREWADQEREYGKRWRELADDAEREARKWRDRAEAEKDPESRRQYEKFAESWEKDARDRRERSGSFEEEGEKYDKRAKDYQDRHDQAVKDADKAVRDAEEKVAAEKEAERQAREKAEQEKIRQEREKKHKEWQERQARWAREDADKARKDAEERRAKKEAAAWEKEFKRLDRASARTHKLYKEAEDRLRRDPGNFRYQREYESRRRQHDQAQDRLAGFMEGGSQGRTPTPPTSGPSGVGDTGPSAAEVIGHQAQDRVLDVTGKVAGNILTEGSTTAGRTAAGAVLGQAMDVKAVIDLGLSAQEVVDKAPQQIKKEMDAIDDPNADPMEIRRHQVGHMGQRLRTMLDSSSPF